MNYVNVPYFPRRLYQNSTKHTHGTIIVTVSAIFKNCDLLFLYCRRLAGFDTVDEMYKQSSCSLYMDNITMPLVFINAQDDPIVKMIKF